MLASLAVLLAPPVWARAASGRNYLDEDAERRYPNKQPRVCDERRNEART